MSKMGKLFKDAERKQGGAVHMTQRELARIKKKTSDVTTVRSPDDVKRIEKLERWQLAAEKRFRCVEEQCRVLYAEKLQRDMGE